MSMRPAPQRLCAALAVVFLMSLQAPAQVDVGFGGGDGDKDRPVEVVSDSLRVDRATGEAVFTGNVVLVRGDLRIAAAEVRVLSAGDGAENGQVDRIFATGGVLMTRGTDTAEGAEARYDPATGVLRMTGGVLVTQGALTIAGDDMTVNLETGSGTVGGRVRTVLATADE